MIDWERLAKLPRYLSELEFKKIMQRKRDDDEIKAESKTKSSKIQDW